MRRLQILALLQLIAPALLLALKYWPESYSFQKAGSTLRPSQVYNLRYNSVTKTFASLGTRLDFLSIVFSTCEVTSNEVTPNEPLAVGSR